MFPLPAGVTTGGLPIEIRLLEAGHAEELFRLIDANRAGLRRWLPWVDYSRGTADVAEHIEQSLERFRQQNGFSGGIWIGGVLSGAIGLHAIDRLHRSSSIGYWLAADRRGEGVMTKACAAVVTAALELYGLHRVEIRCATGNHKSCAIPKRLGFSYEGRLRQAEWLYDHFVDLEVFSILAHEWPRPVQ